MSDAIEILLQDAADALRRRVMAAQDLSESGRAHLAWVLQEDSPRDDLSCLAKASSANLSVSRSYHDVAVLGYAANAGLLDSSLERTLRESLAWLFGRSAKIAGEPAPFIADGAALLGVALGAQELGADASASARHWMGAFLPQVINLPAVETWQQALLVTALHAVGSDTIHPPDSADVADVRTALRARSILPQCCATKQEEDERLTLCLLKKRTTDDIPAVRAALRLAAFYWIRRSAPVTVPGRATVRDVVSILERVPAGLRRWTWEERPRTARGAQRWWDIDNEYHVQNLLYFLLTPLFPDLKDEEYVPSIGQKQARADLFIPSMRLVIEVKFLRRTDKITKIIEEVAADAGLYLTDYRRYSGLVSFVWDNSRRTEEHSLLRDGLLEINGVLGAIVVPRPGSMDR